VIGIIGGTVTAAARTTGHWVSFGMTGAMMLGMTLYVLYCSRTRWGTHWQKYGPTYLTFISGFLVMADLTRHVMEDLEIWPERAANGWGSGEYREGCPTEHMACLSTVGILFTIIFTYSGFTLLMIGTLWNANIWDKLKDFRAEWRRLRGGE
jgi:hypothetical protein